jgi:hypothetical protein
MRGLTDRDHVVAVAPEQHQPVIRVTGGTRTRGYG